MGRIEAINEIGWNAIASKYQKRLGGLTKITDFYYGPLVPTERRLKLIGDVTGKIVLEIGCGTGENAIALAKNGAKKVFAIDISKKQIEFGKKLARVNGVEIEFVQGNIQTLPWIKNKSIDLVVSVFALQYIQDIDRCFKEVARVTKRGGQFVFSLDHPIWFSGEWRKGRFVWQSYWQEKVEWNWNKNFNVNKRAIAFPRNIECLFNALISNGFVVEKILEPKPVERKKWGSYTFKNLSRVPGTIIFKATKNNKYFYE